jgi:uncharacterized protein with NRDE domain
MCLILFAYKSHPRYKLVIAANRDEFYNRKTAPAAFWEDHPRLLAGRDLQAMGTWMGINKNGRISMLTNYRDLSNIKPQAPTRGKLVSNFLITNSTPNTYLDAINPLAKSFNDFNILLGTADDLWYYSNKETKKTMLGSGVYGLSNHLINTPWPKVEAGKEALSNELKNEKVEIENLFATLKSEAKADKDRLPGTGVGFEMERMLSPMFIKSTEYGTRCSTIILVDKDNHVKFVERTYVPTDFTWADKSFEFDIEE